MVTYISDFALSNEYLKVIKQSLDLKILNETGTEAFREFVSRLAIPNLRRRKRKRL